MSNQNNLPELVFTAKQIQYIKTYLIGYGLYNPDDATRPVKSTIAAYGTNEPKGLWSPLYQYISDIIAEDKNSATSSHVSSQTEFWFKNAPAINLNDISLPANNYIRGATIYGLQFRNKLIGQTPVQIANDLQTTSNLIGEKVITEILRDGGLPAFDIMISGDISAAIGPEARPLEQTIGGWGGSFYYWSAPLVIGPPRITVGAAIQAGNPQGDALQKLPSLAEFYYDNSNAAADAIRAIAVDTLAAASPPVTGIAIVDALIVASRLRKPVSDAWAALEASFGSTSPVNVKANIGHYAYADLVIRSAIGKISNQYGYSDVTNVTTAKGLTTTTYADGTSYTLDYSGIGNIIFESWKTLTGVVNATFNANGILKLTTVSPTNQIEYAVTDSTGLVQYQEGNLPGRIVASGNGNDALFGSAGETFVVQTGAGLTETIVDLSGDGKIFVGSKAIVGLGATRVSRQNNWRDDSGTLYSFSALASAGGIGTLTVSGGLAGAGKIEIENFDLGLPSS